ncbi:type II secretion system F family protein [Anoxynatronum buryatiense]|uniref:Type IV pilus assembly protein PilC n=1 Tax=Anoxynatronum buryatiense TaxID=489973 RepID=A0AA45WUY9_9CLOT|nr:type II secretion system F family protein [Anoxynatronum buryatiense]SMP48862.1 type IV pilus assembly protein PilC [Anoxynatronum buryatiense]
MPLYKFKAVSATGENIEGTENASSKGDVIQRLRDKRHYPVSIEEVIEKDIRDIQIFGHISIKHIAVFCRQFYTMLAAGVTIMNTLDILKQQTEHKRFKGIISDLYEDVQKGFTFSEALEKHPGVFPQLMIYMVAAGEASGSLDVVMERMADHYEKEFKVNNRVKSAMVYPIILMVVATLVVIFLLVVVMPTFIGMFQGSGVELPLPTRILLAISGFLQSFWHVLLGALLVFSLIMRRMASTPEGSRTFDRWKLRIPLVKGLTRKVVSARFCRTLSTLLISGIPLLQSLDNVAGAVGNKIVGDGIIAAKDEIRKGAALSVPIRKLGFFPPMVDNMIKIGEESGTLDDILDKTANFFDEEVETEIQRMLTFMEPIMIVVMGVIIGFIVISMVLPMFDVLQTVQ